MAGTHTLVDYEGEPECVMVWGANPLISNPDEYKGVDLAKAMQRKAKIICIDPRRSTVAQKCRSMAANKARRRIGALAWGMINVIIDQGLI